MEFVVLWQKNRVLALCDCFPKGFDMFFTGFLVTFLLSSCWAADEKNSDEGIPFLGASQGNSNEEIPFVVASQENLDDQKVSNLLPDVPPVYSFQSPDNRGRSDIEIEDEQPSRGYFYPKPSKSFSLPQFTTLDTNAQLNLGASFAEESERFPRSPRRPSYLWHQTPPPFIPGFIPPHNIRPLPALYGRPGLY